MTDKPGKLRGEHRFTHANALTRKHTHPHANMLVEQGMGRLEETTKLDFQSFLRDFIDRQPASLYKDELQEILPVFFDVSADQGAMLSEKAERILSNFIPHNMGDPAFVDALVTCAQVRAALRCVIVGAV